VENISANERPGNALTNVRLIDVTAYLDTVEVWLPCLRIEVYREIARLGRVEECRNRHGQLVGFRVIRNRPSKATLQQLDWLARKHRGVLHRVDLAFDMAARPGLREQIVSRAMLKWSRKGQMHDDERTVYWSYGKRSRRNLVLYDDKPSRITGELDCIHVELRFIGADIIRRQGLHKVRELFDLNPRQMFEKHVMWSDAGESYVSKIMRKESDKYRRKYGGQQVSVVMDRFLASIPGQVKHRLRRLGLDRSQNVRNEVSNKLETVLAIPAELSWRCAGRSKMPPLKSLRFSKKGGACWCLSPTATARQRQQAKE
jgi:hypothetical protein